MTTITREQVQKIIDAADEVITALAGTNADVHPDNSTKMTQLYDDLNDHYAPPEVVRELARIALASLEANKPELKIAELINKFYERYPLASFNKDTDRAEALGYFLAGAELQCFGEFIKYEELFGDE
ncbi:hypothetical protein CI428_20825 [Salmonella enterica subsp. enterica serovar Typhimurium]|uniref:Uncharacterized protein n=2 Tax=Salmonella enterica TaxID=28901 RepID=A0A5X6JTK0_SALTM|nr:hypothetical protein HOS28_gp59 [Salmonella phage UPF_BP1]YP_224176.1 gp38 [Enterobacteria phage ES18]AMZ35481.1 hypothetical protein AX08_17985 [Salmonella enterica subsp. enterica serovar Typhimurium str. CDC 2009K-2059]AMZ63069.1 hypothetical protein AW99_15550 [Salmonella enterica subsp. enterica serovar Typhimurium str. USDA-ARS-USMARC-1896]EAB2591313.1 hypothetical protein [Salmonella enterica]EAN7717447.1 hypothetical protein [Salmonella enterica subsp. enterica serovar Typhimurium]